ncbi:hypothetical protein TKK_0002310 [Trichogramma kaykai]
MFDVTLEYLRGPENAVADALSRLDEADSTSPPGPGLAALVSCIDALTLPLKLPLDELTAAQANDDELRGLIKHPSPPLKLVKAAAPSDRPPSAPPVGVSLPSASGMAPLQPSSMAPPPPPAPLVSPQPSASSATATVPPDDLAHAGNSQDSAVPDEDSLSLSDFPDMTQDMQDEFGLGRLLKLDGAFDALRNETVTALERYPHLVELADGVMDEIRKIETSKYKDDIQHRLRPARTGRTRADSAEYEPLPDLPRLVIGDR